MLLQGRGDFDKQLSWMRQKLWEKTPRNSLNSLPGDSSSVLLLSTYFKMPWWQHQLTHTIPLSFILKYREFSPLISRGIGISKVTEAQPGGSLYIPPRVSFTNSALWWMLLLTSGFLNSAPSIRLKPFSLKVIGTMILMFGLYFRVVSNPQRWSICLLIENKNEG